MEYTQLGGQPKTMIAFKFPYIVTSPADTFAPATTLQIITAVWVALWAMSLTGVLRRRALTAQYIGTMRHGLQMIGTYTWRVAARMIDLQPFRNRANPVLISQSMSKVLTTTGSQAAIRERTVKAAHPQPTAIGLRLNTGQKSTKRAIIHASSIPI